MVLDDFNNLQILGCHVDDRVSLTEDFYRTQMHLHFFFFKNINLVPNILNHLESKFADVGRTSDKAKILEKTGSNQVVGKCRASLQNVR